MDINSIADKIVEYGVTLVGAALIMWVAGKIGRWAQGKLEGTLKARKFDSTLTGFFGTMVRYFILLAAVLGILGMFGVETTSVAAVIGGASLALGLAFQGSLGNFAAGVMLLVFRPFDVGDLVSTAGVTGFVKRIGLFTTILDTPDNRRNIVPNGSIFGSNIVNVTHHDQIRADVNVGADYGADIDKTREVLDAAAAGVPGRHPELGHQIFLSGLGGSSVDWQVRVWCNHGEYWDVMQATARAIKMALDEANIGIPYPTMDVHIDGKLG